MPPTASTFMSTTARSTATSSGCGRSSRPSMGTSDRSKRSMASAIATATAEPSAPPARPADAATVAAEASEGWTADDEAPSEARGDPRPDRRPAPLWRRLLAGLRWPTVSPLTRRIVAVNVLPLALLAVGFLYLGKFEASLVGQQIESLHTQGEIFAAALSEGAVLDSADEGEVLLPDLARQMMRRLVEPTRTRARLFDN